MHRQHTRSKERKKRTYTLPGHRIDKPTRQNINHRQRHTQQQRPNRHTRIPNLHRNNRKRKEHTKRTRIPPIRYFRIIPHKLGMDIVVLHSHLLETVEEGLAVVEDGMNDDAGGKAEGEEVGDGVGGGEEQR